MDAAIAAHSPVEANRIVGRIRNAPMTAKAAGDNCLCAGTVPIMPGFPWPQHRSRSAPLCYLRSSRTSHDGDRVSGRPSALRAIMRLMGHGGRHTVMALVLSVAVAINACGGSSPKANPVTSYMGLGTDFGLFLDFAHAPKVGSVRGTLLVFWRDGAMQGGQFTGTATGTRLTLDPTGLTNHASTLKGWTVPGTDDFWLDVPSDLSGPTIAGGRLVLRLASTAEVRAVHGGRFRWDGAS